MTLSGPRKNIARSAFIGLTAAALLAGGPASAGETAGGPAKGKGRVRIVSLKKEFLSWTGSAAKTAEAGWPALFEKKVIAGNEDYYSSLVFEDAGTAGREEALKEHVGDYYKDREKLAEAFDYVTKELRPLSARFSALPGMKADMTLVVMPSLWKFNAKEENRAGKLLAGFGAEYFVKGRTLLGLDREKTLPVSAVHEMFHLYHGARTGLWQAPGTPVLAWIWIDGLATYASKVLNPGMSDADVLLDGGMAKDCEASYREYAGEVLPVLGSKDPADQSALFRFGRRYKALPARAGYCLGLKAAAALSATHTLDEMSGWSEAEASKELSAVFEGWLK